MNFEISTLRGKTCQFCKKFFIINHGKQIFCSTHCREQSINKVAFPKTCAECGSIFSTTRSRQVYCSFKCARKAENKRKGNSKKSSTVKKPCECCGFDNLKAIHNHHINPSEGNAGGIMCLCANCHYIFHSIVGWNGDSEKRTKEDVLRIVKHGI